MIDYLIETPYAAVAMIATGSAVVFAVLYAVHSVRNRG